MSLATRGLAVVLMFLAGCDLYFNGGDDDCKFATGADIALQEFRDPFTGQCQSFGGGGCDDSCGPCPEFDSAQPQPDWGSCWSECESHDEASCIATAGCRAAYLNSARNDGPPAFLGCWAVAPSGPVQGGGCANLDAQECSRHDDCSATYNAQLAPDDGIDSMQFAVCNAEQGGQGCYGDQDCGAGAHCTTSDGECLPPPGCGGGTACPAVCYGKCVMDQDSCTNVDCGSGSHCEQQCTTGPTAPDGTCSPVCVPDQNTCGTVSCPPGHECVETCAGQDPNNPGCGVCTVECVPVGTCAGLTTESACAVRGDCTAVYQGENCTCYPNGGCACEILTYERCEAL